MAEDAKTIDKIQIEVDATSYKASQALESLEKRLDSLQKAMNGIDVSKLQNTQKAIDSVSKSSGTAPKIDTSGFGKAEKDISNSVAKIQQALAGLQSYANAAMNGDSSSFTSFERRVTSIQSSIDVLKEKFAQLGNTNIPTDAFAKLDSQIENTRSHLDALEAKLQKGTDSGGAILSNEEYVKLQTEIQEAGTKLDGLIAKQHELVNQGQAFTDVFGPYKESLDQLEAQLGQTAQTVSDTVSAMNEGASPTVDTSGLEDATSAAKACRVSLLGLFDSAVSKALSGLWSGIKKIASAIKDAHSKSDGFFGKGMMRILKYGFGIRSIYVLFRRLRKAVTESFKELQNSGAFFEETRANVESLKQSLTVLKYQFGAAFEPIFNAVAPALKTLVNNLIGVMNTISAFTAKLMGRSTYSKAVINAAAFASNTGKAAKAQKELNKQLQGFDELNNLTTNNSNPNSGSGGSSDDIPGAVYVEEQVDNVLGDFGKELAEKIRSGDWKGVGQAISDKLSEAMEKINWDAVYQKAKDFGSGLANFLNGLINPRLFGNLGKTLAGALNTALAFLNSFGKTFDWKNFGKSIAEGINNFFKTFDFKQLGETIHTWIAGALDALITFFDETDFEAVGKAIADFIGGLNIPDLAKKLAKLAIKILEALAEAIKGLWSNSSVTGKLAMAIIGIFGVLKLTGLAKTFAGLIGAAISGKTLSIAASGTTLSISGASILITAAEIAGTIGGIGVSDYLSGKYAHNPLDLNKDTFGNDALTAVGQLTTGTLGWSGVAGLISKFTGGSFVGGATSVAPILAAIFSSGMIGNFAGNSFARQFVTDPETLKYYGYDKYGSVGNPLAITKNLDALGDVVLSMFQGNFIPGVKGLAQAQGNAFINSKWSKGAEEWLTPLFDLLNPKKGYMKDLGGILKEKAKEDIRPLKDIAKSGWDALQTFGDKVVNGAVNIGAKVKNMYKGSYLEEGVNTLKSVFGGGSVGGTNILNAWNGFSESIGKANTGFKAMSESANSLVEKTKNLVSGTKEFGTEASNSVAKAKTGFSDFASNAISTFSTAYTKGTKTWNGLSKWATTKAKTAGEGFGTFSGVVSGEFETAYTDSTNKWLGIGTWANGVTTTTASGMSKLPTDVSKQFGDAYSQSTAKWNDLGKWASGETAIVNGTFSTFPSTASGQFGQAYTDSTNKWSGTKKWANDIFGLVTSASRTKLETIPSIFQSNYQSGTTRAEYQVSNFKSWLDRQDLLRKAGVEPDENKFRNLKSRVSEVTSSLSRVKNNTINVSGSGFEALGNKIRNLTNQIDRLKTKGSISLGSGVGFKMFARGGVVGGATPAIVGEAGPEAILPLTDGTIGKLADMIVGDMAVPQMPTTNSSITSGYGATGSSSSEIARQNQLLQEQNQLLRQIAGKELTISSRDVYDATRQEANNYYNRTGSSPFLF